MEYKILSFPRDKSHYKVTFMIYGNMFYSGINLILANASKPFLRYGEKYSSLILKYIENNL